MRSHPRHIAPLSVALSLFAVTAVALSPAEAAAQQPQVRIVENASGTRLQVDGQDLMVLGVNWDYFPRGTTTTYDFWGQPDDFIQAALDREMSLLRNMGGNAIRAYVGITPRWIRYIYEEYGIWTVLNHALGRYGVTLDGVYYANTDYSDEASRAQITAEVIEMVEEVQGTPGLLMYLLGNENNYGLVWSSAETEALPEGERDAVRARYMYSLFGDVTDAIKEVDPTIPVAMANGDLQYIDIIAEEVQSLDVFGANVYRGVSFRDLFEEVEEKLGVPVMFTEFGADRFDAIRFQEDQVTQARYLIEQWREIYENAAGKGLVGNSIGGLTFQWSDGWWKFGQEDRLDIQDINASWPNDAYPEDFQEGDNNMNEEWWGIMGKGPTDSRGFYELIPKAAYYALQEVHALDPYAPGVDIAAIRAHFSGIDANSAALQAGPAQGGGGITDAVRVSGLRMMLETYNTGGSLSATPDVAVAGATGFPDFQGFDRKESFFADFAFEPQANITGGVSVSLLGNVPTNPIDEIFYENRGRPTTVQTTNGTTELVDTERLKIYSAHFSWDDRWFRLDAFYRTGHYHWAYEGDFFNMYREANYGPNLDIYNGEAPLGFEFMGKRSLDGLKVAFGPELWWGANPAVIGKYQFDVAGLTTTAMYQEDLERQQTTSSSFAVPTPQNRRASLHTTFTRGQLIVDVGGLWSGNNRVGQTFQIADGEPGNYRVLQDEVKNSDQFGGKIKLTYQRGRLSWYGQAAAMGLVADGGYDQTQTFSGYALKDTGSGNQWNVLTGFAVNYGAFQIAPNFLYQKPIVAPMPLGTPAPGRLRNIIDDPFAVRGNRETKGAELVLTYDPTPATWMYNWDSDIREDADFAASVALTLRNHPTSQDAGIGIFSDGRNTFAFGAAPPARDFWEVRARLVSKPSSRFGWIANLFGGNAEPNGDSQRLVHRVGGDVRIIANDMKFHLGAKLHDWGPYDYHRDFNQTFPMQLMGDVSYAFGTPDWFDVPMTRIGLRGTYRTLDRNSNRYCPGTTSDLFGNVLCDPLLPGDNGSEWEIRTYIHIGM
ncbi:MAG: glycosidase [Gemmatimonadota bacterium]